MTIPDYLQGPFWVLAGVMYVVTLAYLLSLIGDERN